MNIPPENVEVELDKRRRFRRERRALDQCNGVSLSVGPSGQSGSDAQAISQTSSKAAPDGILSILVGADADGHLVAARVRIVGDTGGYAGTGGKCLLRAGGHSCGPYRVPNVDIESKAVFTNNPTSGAMRGFGTNQAHFAIEGIMDLLALKVGVDGYDIRQTNALRS